MSKQTLAQLTALVEAQAATIVALTERVEHAEGCASYVSEQLASMQVKLETAVAEILIKCVDTVKEATAKTVKPKVVRKHEFVGTYSECSAFCKANLDHSPSPERIDDTTFGVFFRK